MRNGKKKKEKKEIGAFLIWERGLLSGSVFDPFWTIWDHLIGRMDDYRSLYLSLFFFYFFLFFLYLIFIFHLRGT